MNDSRFERFSHVDLSGVRVIKAETPEDWKHVARLRAEGFSRVPGFSARPDNWIDDVDTSGSAMTLLACGQDNEWSATLRIQDGRVQPLELSKFISLENYIQAHEQPVAQFSRLSVAKRPDSIDMMFGLFKAAWLWCQDQRLSSIVCATPRWSRPIYDYMLFKPLAEFIHQFPAKTCHVAMLLPVSGPTDLWRSDSVPVRDQFVSHNHPNLDVTR